MKERHPFLYRISQIMGLLLGAKFFVTILLTFALYVSTFFLFNQEESLRKFVFDFKIHGIIFCAVLSILAGGIINQFYDREKDQLTKPFRTKIQSFLKQKYFLYAYLSLSIISLIMAWIISPRVFVFYLVYQFMMWFYSHKISKILFLNNITFVALSLYPFFGMLIYYQTFSVKILLMAIFLFLILLVIDVLKDTLTKNADKIFNYQTIPVVFEKKISDHTISVLLILMVIISGLIINNKGWNEVMSYYFAAGILVFLFVIFYFRSARKNAKFISINILRLWVFVGILAMLLEGILTKI